MSKKPTLVSVAPAQPEPGTQEFVDWLQHRVNESRDHYFGSNSQTVSPDLERGLLHADFTGIGLSDAERDLEDEQIEAEQRKYGRRHLKPM